MRTVGTRPPAAGPVDGDRPKRPNPWRQVTGSLVTAVVVVLCVVTVDAQWARLSEAPGILGDYLRLMTRGVLRNPMADPYTDYWSKAFEYMVESLQMAWIGTLVGAVLSFPAAFLAARNVSPRPVVFVTRQVLNVIRAIPELILAIAIMLPIFGLGPLAGALALGVGSVGTLGKLGSEVIEAVDPRPVEAVAATGARRLHVLAWGVLPQALPEIVALWLYRFEINIRAGAILGAVGAGGIGSILTQLFEARLWDRIGITLFLVIAVTVLVDQLSARVRHRIIAGGGKDPVAGEAEALA